MIAPGSDGDFSTVIAEMDRYIPKRVRLAMLDLVLAWARVDTTIAQLATAAFSMDPTVGAVVFKRTPVPDRLRNMRELNLQLGRLDNAKALRKLKDQYEKHSEPRNTIAHAACVGFLTAPDRLVFLPFEAAESFGRLAVDIVPLRVIIEATTFAKHVDKTANALIDEQRVRDEPKTGEADRE